MSVENNIPAYDATIVIPTYCEPGIAALLHDLDSACAGNGITAEFLIMDDTPDGTTIRAAQEASTRSTVTIVHRPTTDGAWGGLAGAVLDGIRAARAPVAVVMDGDGQHPASVVPAIINTLRNSGQDAVVASRYTPGGDTGGLDGGWRRTVSSASTTIARTAFPKRVGRKTTDPMTGFFAVRTSSIDFVRVARHAVGFKILLAILATHPELEVTEIPFVFGAREEGESKASIKNGTAFLRQVARMRMSA